MLHQTSMIFMVLMLILLGAYAAEYRMEQSDIPLQAKNILSSFRIKLDKSKVINNHIQVMSFLTSLIKQMVLDLGKEGQQIEKENALFRGTRE
jgi:hypothetical protein